MRDVSTQRRPLLFRQFGYSRAKSTQIPNSWNQLLLLRKLQNDPEKRGMVANIWVFAVYGNIRRFMCYNSKLENAIIDGKIMFSRRNSLVLFCEVA